MTERRLAHNSFTLKRSYQSAPARVFRAFADPELKARWFTGPQDQWRQLDAELDFREGGREINEGEFIEDGSVSRFEATYHEIVEDLRIVYSYEMRVNGNRLSVSLASIELAPESGGTALTLTEQGVYFDDLDNSAQREEGTRELLESLAGFLDS